MNENITKIANFEPLDLSIEFLCLIRKTQVDSDMTCKLRMTAS
jgi:hypothetical protein